MGLFRGCSQTQHYLAADQPRPRCRCCGRVVRPRPNKHQLYFVSSTSAWRHSSVTSKQNHLWFFSSPRIRGITDAKQCFFLSLRPHKAHLCTLASMINFLNAQRRSLRSLVTSNSQICTFGKLYPFWDPSPTNKGKRGNIFLSSLIIYTFFCQAFLTDVFLALSSSKYLFHKGLVFDRQMCRL